MLLDDRIKLRIFGSSHSEEIGVVVEGVGFGETIDLDKLQAFVDRRKSKFGFTTPRKESDKIIIESGIENGITTGGEIVAKVLNENFRRADYDKFKVTPRPSHADYAAITKYGKGHDLSGGGRFSGRITVPLCIAGGIALQLLEQKGIKIGAYIQRIGSVEGKSYRFTLPCEDEVMSAGKKDFPVLDDGYVLPMMREIEGAKKTGDSVGGVVECVVFGLPVGTGGELTSSLESAISKNIFSIPAVKGVEFGTGFLLSSMRASAANDEFIYDGTGIVVTTTNNNGGINGGICNGMPVTFRVAFKPAPSISIEQRTVDLEAKTNTTVTIKGNHDCCFVPRAVPAVEAMTAIAILNLL